MFRGNFRRLELMWIEKRTKVNSEQCEVLRRKEINELWGINSV